MPVRDAVRRGARDHAAIGNVDDHLKNIWMLARPGGYRLAPAFDLVPDIGGRGEHTLSFRQGFTCPSRNEILALAAEWGVQSAAHIIDEVIDAAGALSATAENLGVRQPETLRRICADVRRRTGLLGRAQRRGPG